MAHRASKYLLGYTIDSDIANNDLFPNLFSKDKDDDKSIDLSSMNDVDENDDNDDVSNIFKRKSLLQDNTYNEEFNEDDIETVDDFERISNDHLSQDISRQRNHFKSNFDTDSENELSDHQYSIHSSVVEKMNDNAINNLDPSDRFKFLTNYTQIFKSNKSQGKSSQVQETENGIPLQTLDSNNSVFGLSKLDDFNKFVKMSELNNKIYNKFEKKNPDKDNLLNVIKSKDLEQNFYVDPNGDDERTNFQSNNDMNSRFGAASNQKNWLKWNHKKTEPKDKSDFVRSDDLYLNSPDLSSNSSNAEVPNRYLSRSLKIRHLQMISFGGTLGVGLFLNSGKALTIAGGLGTLLAFIICGIIVLATIVSFCEMVTFVSIVDGVSGLSSRFVDDAFGFATGWLYFLSFSFGLAGEIVASVIMLSYYPNLRILESKGSVAGFVTFFLLSVILSNSISVQVFGEIEYISSFIKLIFILVMIILMIVMNTGGFTGKYIGFKYWDYSKSDFENNLIFGVFRPTFNLEDNGTSGLHEGIGGDLGRFLSLLVAILVVSFAYSGTEIVCIAACEAKEPRKALPSATKRVFWRIVIFYCLSAFVVSLNLYAGDPRLLRYFSGATGVDSDQFHSNYAIDYVGGAHCNSESAAFAGFSSGSQSPWIVALQSANLCELSSVVNGFLVFFAVSCGNAQLYVSSRTMYSLSLQGKAPKFLSKCNKYGIPYNSVAFSAVFGIFAYICVSKEATVVFQNLSNIIASSGIIIWFAMCLSYIRFYYGLKKRPDIIDRNDPSYPYKSFWQPYTAIIGLIGSGFIILSMGFTVFLKNYWDTMAFFTSYGTLILFAVFYFVYKFINGTRIHSLETLDFDSGRREIDRYIWDGNKDYNQKNIKELFHKWISFLA